MTQLFSAIPIPVPAGQREIEHPLRVINQNFRVLADYLNRAVAAGSLIANGIITVDMLATATKTFSGDLSGTLPAATVVGLRGKTLTTPAAGDNGKALTYNNAGASFIYTALYADPLTTRGDLLYRSVSATARLPVGTANQVVTTDGTDVAWGGLSALLDAVLSSTQGSVLYRGASAWAALGPGTSGQFLKTQGADANPAWATGGGGATSPLTTKGDVWGYSTADDRIPVGSDAQVLTADSAQALGLKWALPHPLTTKGDLFCYSTLAARLAVGTDGYFLKADSGASTGLSWASVGGVSPNALLDGSQHSDTVAGMVVRGDVIVGNSTPAWARVALGYAGKYLGSDGTDASWKRPGQYRNDRGYLFGYMWGTTTGASKGIIVASNATTAAASDADRFASKWAQDSNGLVSGYYGNSTAAPTPAMSPCLWFDFKIQGVGKMHLAIGFNSAGLASGMFGANNYAQLDWLSGTDTNFYLRTDNGSGTPNSVDSTVAKDAAWHDCIIWTPDAGTTWYLEIDGTQVYTTTKCPTTSTVVKVVFGYYVFTSGSAGNELRQSYINCQAGSSGSAPRNP